MQLTQAQKQEGKISKLQQELYDARKHVKSLEKRLSTSERKRKVLMGGQNKKKRKDLSALSPCIALSDINILSLSYR
jgi:predicted RNase H-like nuclease (RuvC/YqgF family)